MVRYMCNSPHFNKTSRPEGVACFVCITFWDSNPARGFELPLERVCAWAVRAKHPSGSTFKSKAFGQKSEGFFYGAWTLKIVCGQAKDA